TLELRRTRIRFARERDRGSALPEGGPVRGRGLIDRRGRQPGLPGLAAGDAHHVAGSVGRELDRHLGVVGREVQQEFVRADPFEGRAVYEDPGVITRSIEIAFNKPPALALVDLGRVALWLIPVRGVMPVPRSIRESDSHG